MSRWRKRARWIGGALGALLLIVVAAIAWGWWQMRGSLPQLDGSRALAGLGAAVTIERDAHGIPTVTGSSRADVSRALGFLHAQDRFFQMDVQRRRGAGELSELFGRAALNLDREARLHGFRRLATEVLANAEPDERAQIQAYTAGVNAGLAALGRTPWEYLVIRTRPAAWRDEDSILCIYAMWFDLQDYRGRFERARDAVRTTAGMGALNFLAPAGNSWDAALDGSTFPAPALPNLRFTAPAAGGLAALPVPDKQVLGSNSFALAGAHTATGAAILANDMHLGFRVPHIWYRAVLRWTDAKGPHRLAGVTFPGFPTLVAGSNGHVAWGYTDAFVDTTDVINVATDVDSNSHYQSTKGWKPLEERKELIKVKGEPAVPFTALWTEWGPVIEGPKEARALALRWSAHNAEATNLHFFAMETATTTAEAVAVGHRASFPNENLLIADSTGRIAWTILGRVPRRVGFDGRLPATWSFGDRRWDGFLADTEIPVVTTDPAPGRPAEQPAALGYLWSANNRALGGPAGALLGDSGNDEGARAGQIRDGLAALVASGRKAAPADVYAIQLDDRALFLARWQQFLLEVLTDAAVAGHPERAALREAVKNWSGRADTDSISYRAVRAFRIHAAERAFAPFFAEAKEQYPAFSYANFHYEDALWRLTHERPAKLLNPEQPSWEALLLAAVDDVCADAKKAGGLARFIWGRRNTLEMQHPFSQFLPGFIGQLLNMPAEPLPGDADMPRVQTPAHGQSERLVVSPGREEEGILNLPGGPSGHPLSPYYRAGHDDWARGRATPLLPGPAQHTLTLTP